MQPKPSKAYFTMLGAVLMSSLLPLLILPSMCSAAMVLDGGMNETIPIYNFWRFSNVGTHPNTTIKYYLVNVQRNRAIFNYCDRSQYT